MIDKEMLDRFLEIKENYLKQKVVSLVVYKKIKEIEEKFRKTTGGDAA